MSETTITPENALVVTLNAGQLREIVRQEIERVDNARHTVEDRLLDVKEASELLGCRISDCTNQRGDVFFMMS
jgi:hypothetical protein